jgi:hypothetical protein
MPNTQSIIYSARTDARFGDGLRLLLMAMAAAVMFHGGLLPFTHANTYDAFIHMFFGDHYHRNWFDPWEPRWYTGFATTSYPPGTHMGLAALMYIMPLRAAFVVMQLVGVLLLTVGVFRFSLIWVSPRAAGYAALTLVLASSVSETIHLFGQLPTIFSLGIFLNGLPYFHRWIVLGRGGNLAAAVLFSAATTAAHHVTTIFGGVLFVLPMAMQSLLAVARLHPVQPSMTSQQRLARFGGPVLRGLLLGLLMILAVAITVFPYWYWSVTDPITQVPIPHGSRESFIERPDLGLVFFLIPWGCSLLLLPYAFYKGATTALWPLGLSLALCFVLGTGGTTPIARAILGGAFDILTLDRFTFWGSILILPFIGLMLEGLLHGRSRRQMRAALGPAVYRLFVGGLFGTMAGLATLVAILPMIQPTQPKFVDPVPIVQFLEEDDHDRWRYLTLGFGDQFAYLSAQTTAQSVDGNYHSARRLPDLTRFSVERLENAKYLGVPGLGSLEQFLVNADRYHLKYVFSNDQFYDPLLHFTGWNQVNRLRNGIVVWEKPDVAPLPLYQARKPIPPVHAVMWGILPPLALLSAFAIMAVTLLRSSFARPATHIAPAVLRTRPFRSPARVRLAIRIAALIALIGMSAGLAAYVRHAQAPRPAAQVVTAYFEHLDFRSYELAYDELDAQLRPSFEDMLFRLKWQGGLLNSYGKLDSVELQELTRTDTIVDFRVDLVFLTSLKRIRTSVEMRTVRRDGVWYIVPLDLRAVQTPVRLQREQTVGWNKVGRRQPRFETDLHRDRLDRPEIALDAARLVRHAGRFSVIGQITNTDYDPAAISLFATLSAKDTPLMRKAAGKWGGQRLLPADSAGVRVDFDGVLSLTDAEAQGSFDPEMFLPPEFAAPPDDARIEARAVVKARNLYRGVALNGVQFEQTGTGLRMTGLAVNTGTQVATVIRVGVLLSDADGQPRWMEAGFVRTNVYPGQSAEFELMLPAAEEVEVIAELGADAITLNGHAPRGRIEIDNAQAGQIPLRGKSGYGFARIDLSTMTYQPLF